MQLHELAQRFHFPCFGSKNLDISGVQTDSRNIQPGNIFIALQGHQKNALEFLPQAIQNGAQAVLFAPPKNIEIPADFTAIEVESQEILRTLAGKLIHYFAGDPSATLRAYGVTGTNGKTSVTYILSELFGPEHCGIVGTIQCRYQDIYQETMNTTPSPAEMVSFLQRAKAKGMTHFAFEASSHALDQQRLSGLHVAGAIFTNLTPEHLDYHPSMRHYAEAKKKLFEAVSSSGPRVLNRESVYFPFFQERLPKEHLWSYGFSPEARVWAECLSSSKDPLEQSRFLLHFPKNTQEIFFSLMGKHNIENALAAATLAYAEGIAPEEIQKRLSSPLAIPGRLQRVKTRSGKTAFVDYAHTPDALEKVLSTLRPLVKGRLFCVFGCGGDRDPFKRKPMGEIAEKYSDKIFLTSDNPRSEDPEKIVSSILQGISDSSKVVIELDRKNAIQQALDQAGFSDVLLIAGKGHETYQQIGRQKIPFSDVQVASVG